MQDVVQLVGLLPFSEMTGNTQPLQIQEIVCVGLGVFLTQLNSFFQPLHPHLPSISHEKLGIDLQSLFKLVNSYDYLHAVKDIYMDRCVSSNLDLMKTAVYLHSVHKFKY